MTLVSICLTSVVVVLIAVKLKKINGEYSTLLSIGACLFILAFVVAELSQVVSYLNRITGYIDVNMEYIAILLKMLGIAYICELSSGICKDAGYGAVAAQIGIAGRIAMVVMSLPVLLHVVELVAELL